MRKITLFAVLFAAVVLVGCGKSDGQKRVRIYGDAKFDGQPIPFGEVLFTPDGSKKNSGAQGIAPIRNGKYDTSNSTGKGFAGGPAVIRVTGLTGEGGKLLCEYEYKADLPTTDGTHTIEVPKTAGKKGGGDI